MENIIRGLIFAFLIFFGVIPGAQIWPDDSAHYTVGATVYVSDELSRELAKRDEELPRKIGEPAEIIARHADLVTVKFDDGSLLEDWRWSWFSLTSEGISPSCRPNETPWKLGKVIFLTPELIRELEIEGVGTFDEGQVGEIVSICEGIISVKLSDGTILNGFHWQWYTDTLEFEVEPYPEPHEPSGMPEV